MKTEKIAQFEKLVSDKTSGWLEKALWREENHDWLEKSALIAVKILSALDAQGIKQRELAKKLGVSAQYVNKIVKGSENLSLETISKIETALGIQLIVIPGFVSTMEYEFPGLVHAISIQNEQPAEVNEPKQSFRKKKNP
jgi:transcriptional regulator with XRE-family HTH domain